MTDTSSSGLYLLAYFSVPSNPHYVDLLNLDALLHELTVAPAWCGPSDYSRACMALTGPVPWRRLDMVSHPLLADSLQSFYRPAQERVRKAAAWALERAWGRGIVQVVYSNRELLGLKSNQIPTVAYCRIEAIPTHGSHLLKEAATALGLLEMTVRYDDAENTRPWTHATMSMPLAGFFETLEFAPGDYAFWGDSRLMRRYQSQSRIDGAITYLGFVCVEPGDDRGLRLTPIAVGWH